MKSILIYTLGILLFAVSPAWAQDTAQGYPETGYADDYLAEAPVDNDPLEGLNRGIYRFNKVVDSVVWRPTSKVYKAVFPKVARNRVTCFLDNIEAPVIFINSVLQGDPQNSFVTFWRFVFNSTFGVLGLFDIATEFGMPPRNSEDFGQTLAVWGVGDGPYLVLPVLGPSNLRDTVGLVVNILTNPFTYTLKDRESIQIAITRGIDARARFGKLIDNTYETSLDPYSTFKSLYLQRRDALIRNQHSDTPEQPVIENFTQMDAL